MGFLKKAHGELLRPDVSPEVWNNFQVRTAKLSPTGSTDLIAQASQLFQRPFDPKDYLLSHVTIVASVDTYDVDGMPAGSAYEGGFKVNRKFSNFRITPETQQWVNNNKDSWDRPVIMASYKTFVGAHNWVEHVQIEDLSKGRVIDAVARDIGPSVYVDILVATDRQHGDLIRSIKTGSLNTLSMGCTVDATQCTKCGHWAHDETEMCPCVKYSKGNIFYDNQGRKHIVAELCGHRSIDPHGGVKFIDASWVKVPAFTGAVLRSIVEPTPEISLRAARVLSQPPPEWSTNDTLKAARVVDTVSGYQERRGNAGYTPERFSQWDDMPGDFGEEGEGEGGEGGEEKSPLDTSIEELEKHILDKVTKRLKERMQEEDVEQALSPQDSSAEPNDNLVKWGAANHIAAWRAIASGAGSNVAMLNSLARYNQTVGISVPVEMYRTALLVGPKTRYASAVQFAEACGQALGRTASFSELKQLLALSTLLSTRRQPSATTNDGGHR